MRPIVHVLLVGILGAAFAEVARAQRARREPERFQDADLGIALLLPGDWTRIPQSGERPWISAAFFSDTGSASGTHAVVRILVLPQDPDRARTRLSSEPSDPYGMRIEGAGCATYGAFVEQTTEDVVPAGKKFHVEEVGAGKSPIGPYHDFTVCEGASDYLQRRARVYEREDLHVAIEACLPTAAKDDLDRLWKEVLASIKSHGAAKSPPSAVVDRWLAPRIAPEDYAAWRALPVAKRNELRARSETLWSQAEKRHTNSAWRFAPKKRFTVVSLADLPLDPYVSTLETFAGYLDRTLGPLSDDRVRKWMLRLCRSEHRDAFQVWSHPTIGFMDIVLAVFDDLDGPQLYGAAQEAMFWSYLHEKNALVGSVLPLWLRSGLQRALYSSARIRGGEVDFEGDTFMRTICRELAAKDGITLLRTLVTLPERALKDHCAKEERLDHRMDVQFELAVCFLLLKEPRVPQLREFLTRYLQALAEECATVAGAADRQAFLDAACARTSARIFGADDAVWQTIERAYRAYARE